MSKKILNTMPANIKSLFSYALGLEHCDITERSSETLTFKNIDYLLSNRDIKDVVVVSDDLSTSGVFLANTLPIRPFRGEKYDDCLYYLKQYLIHKILKAEDTRSCIK